MSPTPDQKPPTMSIKAHLHLAFLCIFVILFSIGLLVDQRLRVINNQSTEMAANWMPSIVTINAINTATSDYRAMEGLHVLSTSDSEMTRFEKELERLKNEIAELRKKYKALISSDEERALYQSFIRKYDDYLKSSEVSLALSRQNENAKAAAQLKASGEVFDDMSGELVKLVTLNTQGGAQASTEGDTIYANSRTLLLAMSIAMLALLAVIAWMLGRRISPPVSAAENVPQWPGIDRSGRTATSGGRPHASGALRFWRTAPTLLIIAVAVMVISVSVISNRIFGGMTASTEAEQLSLMRSILETNIKSTETRALARAEMIADLPRTKALLAARDRAGLLAEYREMYETPNTKSTASIRLSFTRRRPPRSCACIVQINLAMT